MISSVEWVPKGVADPNPKAYELSAAEQELLAQHADESYQQQEEEEEVPPQPNKKHATSTTLPKVDPTSLPPELRMDEYSSDEETDEVKQMSVGALLVADDDDEEADTGNQNEQQQEEQDWETDDDSDKDDMDSDDDLDDVPDTREFAPTDLEGLQAMGLSHVGAGAAMNLKDDDDGEDSDDDSDVNDVQLSSDDAILVVAKTEEDFASLEIHVYEETTGNLFVHHDIALPSFPLCLAHGDVNSNGQAGNYCAVGTFSPGIEVWNLDVLNPLEPSCILGGHDTSAADALMKHNMARAASGQKLDKNYMLEQQSHGGLVHGSHTDAVMCLSWNTVHRQVIASGSADTTVKIWDITKAPEHANAATFTHHKDKVQSVEWHPTEGTLLATGSYDKTVALVDARSAADAKSCKRVKIVADVESIQWDPFRSQYLTVATEDGTISCWDVRKFDSNSPVWSFVANEFGGVSDLTYNKRVPGMMATCAVDKTVTLWDTYSDGETFTPNTPPKCRKNKEMGVGKLFTASFYPSSPWLLGCGGSGKEVALWDMSRDDVIQSWFGDRIEKGSSENEFVAPEPSMEETINMEEDFEAMMATKDAAVQDVKSKNSKSSKKKAKGKKKKVHKKSR